MTKFQLRTLFCFAVTLALSICAFAQMPSKVKWSGHLDRSDIRAGETANLVLQAVIDKGWHIYGLQPGDNTEVTWTSFAVTPNPSIEKVNRPIQPAPHVSDQKLFSVPLETHEGTVEFKIPITLKKDAGGEQIVKVAVTSMACDENNCMPPTTDDLTIAFNISPGEARTENLAAATEVSTPSQEASKDQTIEAIEKAKSSGIFAFIWLSFTFGLLALLTPCVWPMIPITVSFFAKKTNEGTKKNLHGALAYCIGIMGTFTLLGIVVTLLFGATGIQQLATNFWVNVGLALLFVLLALNLFGLFEIVIPSSLLTKAQAGSQKGGLIGPILMGLAFSLTTFTCTVPFVGTLLVAAAGTGGDGKVQTANLFYPAVGMFFFSVAFAVPFFLLALFPQYLAKMPKSGGWLQSVKSFMAFLEIAAALKFASNAEIVYTAGLLTKPVFLSMWSVIFFIAGFYALGWIVLPKEGKTPVGPIRSGVGFLTLAAAVYMLAAINGAPLGRLTGFLPPDPYPYSKKSVALARDIPWVESFDEALEISKKSRKAMFLNFTGVTCVNCREMEYDVFPVKEISSRIKKFVPVELYTDRQAVPADQANNELRIKLTNSTSNPVYVVLAPDGKTVLKVQQGGSSKEAFAKFLDDGAKAASEWLVANEPTLQTMR